MIEAKKVNIDYAKFSNKFQSKFKIIFEDYWTSFTWYTWRGPYKFLDRLWNFWRFRKEILNFRTWDYTYNFDLFIKSLELTADGINKREIIVSHKETSDEIKRFIELYKKQVDDNYFEEAGGDYNKLEFFSKLIESTKDLDPMYELFRKEGDEYYTQEESSEIRKQAEILRQKDLEEMMLVFRKYQGWWD